MIRSSKGSDEFLRKCFRKALDDGNSVAARRILEIGLLVVVGNDQMQNFISSLVSDQLDSERQECLFHAVNEGLDQKLINYVCNSVRVWLKFGKLREECSLVKWSNKLEQEGSLKNLKDEVETILQEYKYAGFVLPTTLIKKAAKNKMWLRNAFIPTILKPSNKERGLRDKMIQELVKQSWITKEQQDIYLRIADLVLPEDLGDAEIVEIGNEFLLNLGNEDVWTKLAKSPRLGEVLHVLLEKLFLDPLNTPLAKGLSGLICSDQTVRNFFS